MTPGRRAGRVSALKQKKINREAMLNKKIMLFSILESRIEKAYGT